MKRGKPYIVFDDVSYRYPRAQKYVLKHLSLSIAQGEFVAVLGENGAGKSTFCQTLNGVVPHSRGRRLRGCLTVNGIDTKTATVAQMAETVGIVLEDPETQLFTTSVLEEVAFGPENLGVEPSEILRRASWALDVVRLSGYESHSPAALSGGQKQRLAIAAALTMLPRVLVLDEATSQLDPVGATEVFAIVEQLNKEHNMTVVMATDKGEEVAQFCDRVLVLHNGELLADGTPYQVFSDADVLGEANIRIPQVSELANYLARCGTDFADFPITLEEALQGTIQLLGGGN